MGVRLEHANLRVANLDRSLAFYVDRLGLTLRLRRTMQDGTEMAFVGGGGAELEIICDGNAAQARDVPKGEAGVRHLAFACDDVDALHSELVANGAPLVEAPRPAVNADVFRKVGFVRDPDGVIVELAEVLPR